MMIFFIFIIASIAYVALIGSGLKSASDSCVVRRHICPLLVSIALRLLRQLLFFFDSNLLLLDLGMRQPERPIIEIKFVFQ